eukprot:TRINITY_DN28077_c0_g1_i1.p1 TRINITY_DN28077_c0_g1~~TRINITY_DN28077_c0_g1_i1.p1  ORF type:complete len:150 (+),score=16.77 TRINITY_DN28077_c0_g1_i1:37-450(+)
MPAAAQFQTCLIGRNSTITDDCDGDDRPCLIVKNAEGEEVVKVFSHTRWAKPELFASDLRKQVAARAGLFLDGFILIDNSRGSVVPAGALRAGEVQNFERLQLGTPSDPKVLELVVISKEEAEKRVGIRMQHNSFWT